MTVKQLEVFNTKIDILFDQEANKFTLEELSRKYKMSRAMVIVYLRLAKRNYKILNAVKARKKYKLNEYIRH